MMAVQLVAKTAEKDATLAVRSVDKKAGTWVETWESELVAMSVDLMADKTAASKDLRRGKS